MHFARVCVTQGDCKGIGRIGRERPGNIQQAPDHQLHLFLLRRTGADDGEFDRTRRVLEHPRAQRKRRAQRRSARLSQLECAAGIAVHEHAFDCHFIGPEFTGEPLHAEKDFLQALRQRLAAGANGATDHVGDARSAGFDDGISRTDRARIEAQDAYSGRQGYIARSCAILTGSPGGNRDDNAGRSPANAHAPCTVRLGKTQLSKTSRPPESAQEFPPLAIEYF